MILNPRSKQLAILALTMGTIAVLCASSPTTAKEPANEQVSAALAAQLQPLIDAHQGVVGVMVKDLKTGVEFRHRVDEPMPTASLIKFPIMIATYQAIERGDLKLDRKLTLQEEDKVPGSGILTEHFEAGTQMPLKNAIHLMMAVSDNTATNLVIDQLGLEATNDLMESLGCPNTKLHAKVFRRDTSIAPERSQRYGLGSTTAAEMVKLLESLQNGELVSQEASKLMREQMSAIGSQAKFPRLLPDGVKLIHKTGSVSAARTDAGIILSPHGPIALCVLTEKNKDQRWADDNAGEMLCSHIAKEVYDLFNPDEQPTSDDQKVLKEGANGLLVEALQRTLNARTNPSVGISVDGDYGPGTQKAIIAFQTANNLTERGQVGPETWQALGTLLEEEVVPNPEIVNAEVFEKQPADDLQGPPFVTAKAWAIGDATTGELLWGHDAEKSLDMASTTKIMTAFLVTSYAEKHPEVLNETITFSKRADETSGSSARIRAGESLTINELLYGLLLPSGNDASVAFAEHFGKRLAEAQDGDSYDHFITAMNKTANRLGMKHSQFKNTHGLTEENHHTSAADLLMLGSRAMQQPLFRKVVSTPQHGCTVTGEGGYKRNLLWKNTNRLLKIEGYGGVKTGTTNAAGSCLVSQGTRDGRSLIVVVLGSCCTDARYADSKNLYRWAWQQLANGE
ncbi:serine hydrolase [Adhaeretor mobilis]|uniref:beta-lactamase n=1 Tax=Adhaeretor mobilis TaxID=1930276 RepID=A0A517MTN7_9BACT|nr:serine hydrolase [Adhaeretor mobilis]QDS98256.1 D-alanyl-D-alanine carboxypeptidase DacB precursor [Adhaeretor mobilis]